MLTRIEKFVENKVDSEIQTASCGFLRVVTPHTYVIYKTPTILKMILLVMVNFIKEKNPTTELNIFLSNFLFDEK